MSGSEDKNLKFNPSGGDVKNAFTNKKRFGQNFLRDKNILREIAASAELSGGDTVLEIGPGKGALTAELLSFRPRFIHCVEIDRELEDWLRPLEAENSDVLKVHFADAVKFDYSALIPFPNKAAANIPYNITTPLICALLRYAGRGLTRHIYTVQLEAARRLTARADTKERYPLGVTIEAMGGASGVKILRDVARTCFRPVPNVDSCVIEINLTRNFELGADALWNKFLHEGFKQRRKTLVNNLKGLLGLQAGGISDALARTGLPPNIRAEDLESGQWIELYGLLRPYL